MAAYTLFFLICCSNLATGAVVYHITPNAGDPCTMPCSNLTLFAANFSSFLSFQNVTVLLLSGKHYLSTQLQVFNQDHFQMASLNTTAQVVCEDTSLMSFNNTRVVHIMNVEFIGCGHTQFKDVNKFTLVNSKFMGTLSSGTALEITETNTQITSSTFLSNTNGMFRNLTDQLKLIKKILGIQDSELNTNSTWIGGALVATHSDISIESSTFESNSAEIGGALFMESCSLDVINTTFIGNNVHNQLLGIAGALYLVNTYSTLTNSYFNSNFASVGGVAFILRGRLNMYGSRFTLNSATYGGALFLAFPDIIALQCQFDNNKAEYGGVLRSFTSNVAITVSQFVDNNATFGGVILSFNSSLTMNRTEFSNNTADVAGAVLVAAGTTITSQGSLLVSNNSAKEFGVMYLSECSGYFQGNSTFSNNFGTLLAIYSNITFSGIVAFTNNIQLHTTTAQSVNFQDGGALSLFQSNVIFGGESSFECNRAENGGAIHSIESNLFVGGSMTLAQNRALRNGGGIYLSQSELSCGHQSILNITSNTAINRGGGIHAIGSIVRSTTIDESNLRFINNSAVAGGGLYLETNAKLYIHKLTDVNGGDQAVHFINNVAEYGGAVYVDDHTNTATCTAKSMECFFRVVYNSYIIVAPNIATISFEENYASSAGSNLFGGLLDRCIVSPFARLNIYAVNAYRRRVSGITYFKNVSTEIKSSSVSSYPTRVCQCTINNQPNCSYYQLEPVMIKKGQTFSVSLVAVNQIGQPVDATIQSILMFNGSGLAEGQLTRSIAAECTALPFSIVSPQDNEVLSLYASNGPCNNADLSTLNVDIGFLTCICPIGFQASKMNAEINCTCECHERISRYVMCDPLTESLMRQSQSIVWIAYINDTNTSTGYLVFPNCPYDYCNPLSVTIDLTQVNGEDRQCAFNRSGLLCGSCQSGLSLSLGSSRCLQCPTYWPVAFVFITAAALLAGIVLVVALLVLNMTVAIGTLNGLIFYVNVVAANRSILLPFEEQNFITVFVSWLNLELGIDTCYFPGMDAYSKTWIQLSFVAAYVVFLIAFMMIVISSYSSKFTNFIGKRNPVATLSTLVFLSYAKLLEIVFTALSVSVVQYPNGSNKYIWLPDASVTYLQGKHIVLFIAALILLQLGLIYTILLLSWQWLLCLPSWRVFSWTRNQKLHTFIETYHAPYISKHRYWTGMLLLIRAVLYLIAAVNISNDPRVTLVSIIFTLGFMLLLKAFIGRLYRKWPLDVLETFFYFNLMALSLFAWYFINSNHQYRPIAYVSITITFILLVAIIIYHLHTYTVLSSKLVKLEQRIKAIFGPKPKPKHQTPPPDEFLDMVDRPISANYKRVFKEVPEGHTSSVLDIHALETPSSTGTSTSTTTTLTMSTLRSQQTMDTSLSTDDSFMI